MKSRDREIAPTVRCRDWEIPPTEELNDPMLLRGFREDEAETGVSFTLQLLHAVDLEGDIDALENAPRFSSILNALKIESVTHNWPASEPQSEPPFNNLMWICISPANNTLKTDFIPPNYLL